MTAAVESAKALATQLFDSGQVVLGVWHLPAMLTRDYIENDLRDVLTDSDHPVLAFIAEAEDADQYHIGLDRGAVPVWLVHVEDSNGDVMEGVGDTFEDAVHAARKALAEDQSCT